MAADATRIGMDYHWVLDRGKDEFMLNMAILSQAIKDRHEEDKDKIEALSKFIAAELAEILGKIF